MITIKEQPLPFLNSSGEKSNLICTKDWIETTLGAPENWPHCLRTAVGILLNSQFPVFVWWGEELNTIYNDAYITIAGEKHPSLLGKSGREAWAEIWPD